MSTGVTNTSPLIAFSAIQRLDLLQNVFTRLLVPEGVQAELFPTGSVRTQAQAAQEALTRGTWMEVIKAPLPSALAVLTYKLGADEMEAIAVALERRLPVVMMISRREQRLTGWASKSLGRLVSWLETRECRPFAPPNPS